MLGALLIALREGLEAVLIVSILYAYVKKVEREDLLPKLPRGARRLSFPIRGRPHHLDDFLDGRAFRRDGCPDAIPSQGSAVER